MISPEQYIEIRGERVGLLLTPSLYAILHRKGWEVKTTTDIAEIQSAYIKLFYAAALNYVEVKNYEEKTIPELELKLLDFEIWAALNGKEFGEMILKAVELLTGKPLKDLVDEKKK